MGIKLKNIPPTLIAILQLSCRHPFTKQDQAVNRESTRVVSVMLPIKNMREDLSILWSAIKELHPGYGYYTSTDSLQRAYHQTYAAIKTPLTESQFISLIYPFLCNLRCGHTQIKHSVGYSSPANTRVPHLPFEVLVQSHRAWITTSQSAQLTTGDEIISINNVPVSTIIDNGYSLYNGDGYNQTFKELFLSEYDGFEDVCNHYYHWPGHYRLKIRTTKATVKSLQVNAAKDGIAPSPSDAKFNNYANWTIAEVIPNSRLHFLKSTPIALFQCTPFAYADTTVFVNAFKKIKEKGIKTLILDMRHNTGGDLRVATKLLSFLADSAFRIVKDVKSRLPNPAINSLTKYFDTSSTSGFLLGFKPTFKEGSWYHIEAKPAFGNIYGPFPLDHEAHFNGRLVVLIDGATFSSGALLSTAIKTACKKAIFIGRETAGAEEGCNGVTLQKLTLPNTKIIVDFPWMRVISMAKHPVFGRGIIPDYIITYSPTDVVLGKDRDLEKAILISAHH